MSGTEYSTQNLRCEFDDNRCHKFAQYMITYKIGKAPYTGHYCPPHTRMVESHLSELRVPFSIMDIEVYNAIQKDRS